MVADRENDRIQFFTPTGEFLDQWTHVQRPTGLAMDREGLIYVSELWWRVGQRSFVHGKTTEDKPGRVSVLSPEGKVLARFGHEGEQTAPGNFIAPHGIGVDSKGDIYVAEVTETFGVKGGGIPSGSHSLQKFARGCSLRLDASRSFISRYRNNDRVERRAVRMKRLLVLGAGVALAAAVALSGCSSLCPGAPAHNQARRSQPAAPSRPPIQFGARGSDRGQVPHQGDRDHSGLRPWQWVG